MSKAKTTVSPPADPSSYRIVRKFAHLLGAQWIRDALHTAFLIYLARTSTSDYGEFMLAFSTASIVLFLAEFGLNQPLVAALSKKYSHKGDVLAQYSIIKGALLLAGWIGVFIFISWQGYTAGLKNLVLVITVGVGMEALASSFFVACRVRGRQDLESRIRAGSSILGYGYGLAMLLLGAMPHWIALFKVIENGCNLVGGMYMALRKADFTQLTLKKKSLARTWHTAKGGIVFVLMALAAIVYNKANIFYLQQTGGPNPVAQYGVTWELVDGISIMVSNLLLRSVLYPLFVQLWKRDKAEFTRLATSAVRWLLGAAIPVMFFLYVESDRLIPLVYGSNYIQSIWMQKVLVFSVAVAFLHNLAAYIMMSQHKERLLLFIYIGGLIFNLTFCAVVIPQYPLLGACLAIVLTKAIVCAVTTSYCHFTMGFFKWRELYPILVAVLAGAGLYALVQPLQVRELSEAAALLPMAYLWRNWLRELKRKKAATV